MIAADAVAVILLAAGLSTRFGPSNKLVEPLDGLPLGLHAARTLGSLPFAARIVVTRDGKPDFGSYGFTPVINPTPDTGQSGSIRLGLVQARLAAPEAVLIALADMPFMPVAHVEAMMARFEQSHPIVGSWDGEAACPPALFGRPLFDALEALGGDRGAGALLRGATLVAAAGGELADMDTLADFASASGSTLRDD